LNVFFDCQGVLPKPYNAFADHPQDFRRAHWESWRFMQDTREQSELLALPAYAADRVQCV
jgi:hypothetical protein